MERKNEIELEKQELIKINQVKEEKMREKNIEKNINEAKENSEIEKIKSIQLRSNSELTSFGFEANQVDDDRKSEAIISEVVEELIASSQEAAIEGMEMTF